MSASRGLVVLSVVFSWMEAAVEEGGKRNRQRGKRLRKEQKKQRLSKHLANLIKCGLRTPEYIKQLEAELEEEETNDVDDHGYGDDRDNDFSDDDPAGNLRELHMCVERFHRRELYALEDLFIDA